MTYGDWLMIALAIIVIVVSKYRSHVSTLLTRVGAAWAARRSRTTTAPSPGTSAGRKAKLVSALAIVGGVAFLWMYSAPLELSVAGTWAWAHWLQIAVGLVIVLFLAEVNNVSASAKGVLHQLVVGAVFLLFGAFPVWGWLNSPTTTVAHTRVRCPDASITQTRSCVLGETGSEWLQSEVRLLAGQYDLCLDRGPLWDTTVQNGRPKFRFFPRGDAKQAAKNGQVVARYRIMKKGTCPTDPLP